MKLVLTIVILAMTVLLLSFQGTGRVQQPLVTTALADVRQHVQLFAASTIKLENTIKSLKASNPATVNAARNALKDCRYQYKSIEYFLEYFFKSSAHIYNAPAKIEVEEPELEYEQPMGFQVMESLLFQKITPAAKLQLIEQAGAVRSSAQDIPSLFYQFKATDEQLLQSVREELIRIETLNITGYDAPLLKSGISESVSALRALRIVFAAKNDKAAVGLSDSGIAYLRANPNFDRFNRLHFITTYITPLQNRIGTSLFAPGFLKVDSFYKQQQRASAVMIALGKRLFFEKNISGNSQRSCAGCHQPEKYFTDGLPKSPRLDGHGTISRNAPTLLYAAYQYSQDWDGRARSIEEQVINVMHNKDEMNADSAVVIQKLKQVPEYSNLFERAFAARPAVTITNLSAAIAAYLRTLAPFNSAFDRYMNGDRKALNAKQISGFNLFMGKAQCGTCHFAPIFNGLTPPGYQATEYEILGTPLTDDLQHPKADPDMGRYVYYPTRYYKRAFKTPTVRNVARTAPYMHNGGFRSLQTVVDLYNKGGGQGIGLDVAEQTLAPEPLKLNKSEVKNIVAFLNSLTDRY
ncbi:cytochrome-c peroxidase [Mucilaginibacter sp. AW1-3]